jgi:hypothetical protein
MPARVLIYCQSSSTGVNNSPFTLVMSLAIIIPKIRWDGQTVRRRNVDFVHGAHVHLQAILEDQELFVVNVEQLHPLPGNTIGETYII